MVSRLPRAVLGLALGSPLLLSVVIPARADTAYGYSKVEQQFIEPINGGGSGKGTSILNTTNPMELMNQLRRGAAMDDATPPKDSIDAALRELEQLEVEPRAAKTSALFPASQSSPVTSGRPPGPADQGPAPMPAGSRPASVPAVSP